MGRGSYQASDWIKLKNERKLSEKSSVTAVFDSKGAKPAYLSRNVPFRESRDSVDSPCSTPVILGFDVTASMGFLAKELAVQGLNRTITLLLKQQPIRDPQVLCAAVGDSKTDVSPLQVTQFESDIRILRQLMDLHLEGGGGGNNGESYHLLWYFAARHTRTDCYDKRNRKGFLFTVGDDSCHPLLSTAEIGRVFGDRVSFTLSNEELLREVQQKYYVFHIHINAERPSDRIIREEWQRLLPGSVTEISRKQIHYLAELIYAVIAVREGKTPNTVLSGLDQFSAEAIAPSLALIDTAPAVTANTITF